MYDVCTYPANLAAGKPVNSAICMQIRNSQIAQAICASSLLSILINFIVLPCYKKRNVLLKATEM